MLKKRALSFLMALVMVCSLLPATALAAGETDAITIQEKSVTPSTTTVNVTVTGYEGLSNATLRLSTGPEGSESDWGISNRTALGRQTYTGPGTYPFSIDASKLTSGNNVQAFLYYWDDDRGDYRYIYGAPVDILDGPAVPSASITSKTVTNRTTELIVTLKNLPDSGIFRVVQLDADESFDSAKLNSYTSLYFSTLSNLKAGENTLTLNSTPTAGCKLLAVIRDISGNSMKDYVSAPVTVTYEQEPAVLSIVGTVDSSSTSVVVNLTRVPATGVLKIIALDAGEAIPDDVFNYNYTGALYTGYLFSANLKVGENTLTLNANPAAGKVLYAVMKDSDNQVYTSDGVTVAQAAVPFRLYIKGKLEQTSTELSVLPLMKSHNAVPSTLQSAVLSRKDTDTVLSRVADPKMGEVMTFSGLSGLTAGEKLTVTVTYDSGKIARQDYLVCDAAEEDSFEIVETQFTTTSTTLTVKVSGYNWYNNREDWSRICISTGSANQTKPGDDEGREDLTSQTFTGKGTYTFTIPADKMSELKEGNSIMAALRFYDGNGVEGRDDWEYYADAKTLLISGAGKTPLERLANCSVSILKDGQPRTETFKQESTTVDYAVTLDDEIPSAALSFYAYPGTVSFDPDNNHHISLGGVKVTGSGSGTVSIDLTKVPVGYRVIASLYVCIDGNEWYRHVNSAQTPEVVDKNGQGFQDYDYPDAKIDETELKAGATSLHVTLTGDQRLFDAAAAGKTTLTVAIAQYPANENFNFDGLNQIALVRNYTVKEAFSGKEFTFGTPLKAGYRVRAVVYWTQNVDLYLAPGNDYEEKFHKSDDSVLISGQPEPAVTVAIKAPITLTSKSITFTLGGSVPEGAFLLAKSYPAGTTSFATDQGTPLGNTFPSGAGDYTVSLQGGVTLSVGEIVVGFLLKGGELQAQSQPVTVTGAAEKEKPTAYLLTQKITAGMTSLSATMRFDSSISSADYKLYQFTGDTLDTETATVLTYGSLYKSQTNYTLYMGIGRLKAGSHLQLVLTAGGEEARSAVLTVEPSPNWGTPYAAFSVSAVKSDAKSVSLTVDYADEYLSMGDDFYCDVTIYACPGEYTDDEIKDSDLWENYNVCRGVAKANSRLGGETRGQLTLDFYKTAGLKAGERLFIKLRLPHVEWEGEEVDYVSASIPVIAAEDEIPAYSVVLYNLDEDTSRGARLRTILSQLGIPAVEMTYENLNQSVGYLAGLDGYETASAPYSGKEYTAEFMLLCNLPEALLDRFLDAMQADGLRIDHKAVVTAYNRDTLYYELMDDIADEHSVFQMLLQLNSMVEESKKVSSGEYGQAENWDDFQKALNAGIALIRSEEPSYEDLSAAYEALKKEYLAVTGQKELAGTAVISIAEEAGGTYSMTASVAGGNADGHYAYTWANGSTEQTVTGIPAQRLIGTTVTVTAEGCYGKLTAQLAVPACEAPAVSAGKTSVTVQLQPAEGGANTPAATQYVVSLYRGGQMVETRTVSSAESVVFSGLSSSTAYTVKSYAVSPVGRSDILTQTVTTQSGSSGSGSSGSSGSRYGVSVADSAHGDVTVTPGSARRGDTVTVTVKPDAGYELDSITVKDADGKTLRLTDKGQGRYTFTMPGSRVSVSVSFKAESAELPFADVPSGSYYEDAVLWALRQGITTGTGAAAFGPDLACTRAQAVTFLWRASGSPAPKSADTAFTDVVPGSYYYDAVLWAVENGITGGTTASTFDPDGICSRAQIVAFLWRSQESPAVDGANLFTDVSGSAYYAGAVLWAASEKVTAGISEDTFAPQRSCTRAQIITFLWRALAE